MTKEQRNQVAKWNEPGRLSSGQIDRSANVIHWPPLLRDAKFHDPRCQLDQLFHNRTPDNSGADSDSYLKIKQSCTAMQAILDGMIDQLPGTTWCDANHFIKSLEYEGQFAAK